MLHTSHKHCNEYIYRDISDILISLSYFTAKWFIALQKFLLQALYDEDAWWDLPEDKTYSHESLKLVLKVVSLPACTVVGIFSDGTT